jgi:hypothetical protein
MRGREEEEGGEEMDENWDRGREGVGGEGGTGVMEKERFRRGGTGREGGERRENRGIEGVSVRETERGR